MPFRTLLALLFLVSSAETVRSEIFECVEADGSTRFVNDVNACERAVPHPLEARIERLSTPIEGAVDVPAGRTGVHLEQLLLGSDDVGASWSVVGETPIDPVQDPDLISWGVRAQRSRHYTRSSSGAVQVCSIELWAFEDTQRATAAHENFSYPDWLIERAGPVLVMVRALTKHGEGRQDRTLFSACAKLGERVRLRASRTAGD